MTFLELCQKLQQRVSDVNGAGPTSVTSQTGDLQRIVNWIGDAWNLIQTSRPDWLFLRKTKSFNTVAQQQSYSPTGTEIALTDFGNWRNDSWKIYMTSAGIANEIWLQQYDYDSFRDYYLLGPRTVTYARPQAIAIAPDKSLVLGLPPDTIYTVTGEYYRTPQVLAANADEPLLPARFHMIIVYRAMMMYGAFEAAPEVYQEGESLYDAMLNQLELDQTMPVVIGGPLIK